MKDRLAEQNKAVLAVGGAGQEKQADGGGGKEKSTTETTLPVEGVSEKIRSTDTLRDKVKLIVETRTPRGAVPDLMSVFSQELQRVREEEKRELKKKLLEEIEHEIEREHSTYKEFYDNRPFLFYRDADNLLLEAMGGCLRALQIVHKMLYPIYWEEQSKHSPTQNRGEDENR
jgi:hypothetical protein